MKKQSILILILCLFFGSHAIAASINQRQSNQRTRIEQGIASGSLTKKEAKRMIRQQQRIQKKEYIYRSDGKLTAWERHDLQTDLNKTNKHIYHQKHDAQNY